MFTIPLTDLTECATGRHFWLTTARIGIAICETCGIYGYCLYCVKRIPPGAALHPCRYHRYAGMQLHDSFQPCTALGAIRP
jgi:hypothetical protein